MNRITPIEEYICCGVKTDVFIFAKTKKDTSKRDKLRQDILNKLLNNNAPIEKINEIMNWYDKLFNRSDYE